MRESATFFWFGLLLLATPTWASEPLLRIGQPPVDATFLSATDEGIFQFQVEGKARPVTAQELIRWSTTSNNFPPSAILLTDGSRLALAESWTSQLSWQLTDKTLTATTQLFGKITVPRDQLQAILLNLPADPLQRTRFIDQLHSSKNPSDQLFFINGDQLPGKILGLTATKNQQHIEFLPNSATRTLKIAPKKIAAIACGFATKTPQPQAKFIVGLRDGSLLHAQSLVASSTHLHIKLAVGTQLTGSDHRDIVALRSLVAPCRYLSDLTPIDYRHVPYLQIPWPYQSDRNVLAGPLQTANRTYSKGIGMLTAARLTYRLEVPKVQKPYTRFVAEVALDDAASHQGSVIFRVYLKQESKQKNPWQLAYTSPLLRSGDPPTPVTVQLKSASQLMLTTDFADRGDALDYANWLDARLE